MLEQKNCTDIFFLRTFINIFGSQLQRFMQSSKSKIQEAFDHIASTLFWIDYIQNYTSIV